MTSAPTLRCDGCGRIATGIADARCPAAGDGGDHVLAPSRPEGAVFPREGEANPFVRYRALTHAYAVARSRGLSDDAFVATVRELDRAVADVCGTGFVVTPFARSGGLSGALGLDVWIKEETRNVAGSHKGRHLFGLAILGEVLARTGEGTSGGKLAIASCGNAALAAAVVARAWRRELEVFLPTDANARVVGELERLGAAIHVCPRADGVPGDPCYLAFRAAVGGGAVPFCCQGSDNGLTVEGGETLAWEIASAGVKLDRVFVQVGGGALASAVARGFAAARALGAVDAVPRLHPVQTESCSPLRRAWERVVARMGVASGTPDAEVADRLRGPSRALDDALAFAAAHRAEFMWPWETAPHSAAHGILDDETYDWLAVVRGTLESGGFPVVVGEPRLAQANALARGEGGVAVDATGSSGLAGLLELAERGAIPRADTVACLFTGAIR